MCDRVSIFAVYNRLKSHEAVTRDRLNKALAIALKNKKEDKYFTNLTSCTCPDQTHRGNIICKHRLAWMMMHPVETGIALFEETI